MNSFDTLFIILALILTSITYVSTSSYLSSGVVLLVTLLYFYLFARNKINLYILRSKRFHSCYTFINSFLVSLSIKGSLIAAFDSVKLNMDKEYLTLYEGILALNDEEKLDYLSRYYSFDIYSLFLSIIRIYQEQGGEIFDLSRYLSTELRRSEDYLIKSESIIKRKIIDFAVLWFFTLLIVIILKYALNQFYDLISNLVFFKISVVALMVIVILSIHVLISKVVKIEIRGFKNVK